MKLRSDKERELRDEYLTEQWRKNKDFNKLINYCREEKGCYENFNHPLFDEFDKASKLSLIVMYIVKLENQISDLLNKEYLQK